MGGGGAMSGAASSSANSNATAASSAAQSGGNAPASSPDVTVNISGTAKAALAAETGQSSITVNFSQGNSTVELQNLLGQNAWDNLIADLLLALLLQQMQNK
jgi:hypothetical protein